jgi:hypothetical protein
MITPETASPDHCDAADFVEAVRTEVPQSLPPQLIGAINDTLDCARCYVDDGDLDKVWHLLGLVRENIAAFSQPPATNQDLAEARPNEQPSDKAL